MADNTSVLFTSMPFELSPVSSTSSSITSHQITFSRCSPYANYLLLLVPDMCSSLFTTPSSSSSPFNSLSGQTILTRPLNMKPTQAMLTEDNQRWGPLWVTTTFEFIHFTPLTAHLTTTKTKTPLWREITIFRNARHYIGCSSLSLTVIL